MDKMKSNDEIIMHYDDRDITYKLKGDGKFEYKTSYGTLYGPAGGVSATSVKKITWGELREDINFPKKYQNFTGVTFKIGKKSKRFNVE